MTINSDKKIQCSFDQVSPNVWRLCPNYPVRFEHRHLAFWTIGGFVSLLLGFLTLAEVYSEGARFDRLIPVVVFLIILWTFLAFFYFPFTEFLIDGNLREIHRSTRFLGRTFFRQSWGPESQANLAWRRLESVENLPSIWLCLGEADRYTCFVVIKIDEGDLPPQLLEIIRKIASLLNVECIGELPKNKVLTKWITSFGWRR